MILVKFVRLKKIREDNDNTQQEIADILKVKRGTYASWEASVDAIPIKKLFLYAKHYNKSIDYILGLSNENLEIISIEELNTSSIGNRLKNIRKKLKLSQAKFAESIGINQSTWWAYENGKTLISTTSLITLAKKYNISVDWILGIIN